MVASPDADRLDRQGLREAQARRRAGPGAGDELQEHCKRVTAPYKYPREIEFIEELPKTVSGKIRRVELRRREESADARLARPKFAASRIASAA